MTDKIDTSREAVEEAARNLETTLSERLSADIRSAEAEMLRALLDERDALVAAAYEDAAKVAEKLVDQAIRDAVVCGGQIAEWEIKSVACEARIEIACLDTADAQAALDRMLEEAEKRGTKRAAKLASEYTSCLPTELAEEIGLPDLLELIQKEMEKTND